MRLLVGLAITGAVIAALAVIDTNRAPATVTTPLSAVPPPFASYVVGTGITENRRGNVAVGTATAGVVQAIEVQVGDTVAAGQPLFRIDDRDLRARRVVAQASLREAEAAVAKPRHRLGYLTRAHALDPADISAETLSSARDDLAAAESAVAAARASEAQIGADLERLVVRAPGAGRVLQVNTRVGEFAESGPAQPLILLGDDSRMFLRVDIDENDAWRFRPQARARAVVRGNPRLSVPLRYEYTEPYVTPKTSLTGQSTERPDQRVLQVIYSFERGALPLYLGQQMDAYIEAPPLPQDRADRGPR
ncbi:efflux RND transporter periplasmic adaptor subunit [Lysobacter terrae]